MVPERRRELDRRSLDLHEYGSNEHLLERTDFPELGERSQGKVRDVYTLDEQIIFITTDRYSAFDRNLALIPHKGEVVSRLTRFWFDKTAHIVPNHVIDYPDPNVLVAQRCEVLPVEVVVRGYITGSTATSLWTLYEQGERGFGDFQLPDHLQKNQQLESAVITPTTKFEARDRPLSKDDVVRDYIDEQTWGYIQETAHQLFAFGQDLAWRQGLILVDTKYEFGRLPGGTVVLIDEIHTPDSSRYWQEASYPQRFDAHEEPQNFDKEFLRLWFRAHCDPYGDEVLPPAPPEMTQELSKRYVQIYEQLTGQAFEPDLSTPVLARIADNLHQSSPY